MRKAPAKRTRAEYEVGWGRAPKKTQFKPGQSGNPNGRPRIMRKQSTYLREVLEEKIQIEERGRMRTITMGQAIIRRSLSLALKGNTKALQFWIEKDEQFSEQASVAKIDTANMSDEEILNTYVRMVKQVR